MTKSLRYIEAFSMSGKEITLPHSLVDTIEMFVCHMYGWKENDVDNVRYRMHCKSSGKISCIAPCNDALTTHFKGKLLDLHLVALFDGTTGTA